MSGIKRKIVKTISKSSFGQKMKEAIKPTCTFHVRNNNIIVVIEGESDSYRFLMDDINKVVTKGEVSIPYNKDILNKIEEKGFQISGLVHGQWAVFNGENFEIVWTDEKMKIDGKLYGISEDSYINYDATRDGEDLLISTKEFSKDSSKSDSLELHFINKKYTTIKDFKIKDNKVVVKDIDEIIEENERLQLVFINKDAVLRGVPQYFEDDSIVMTRRFSKNYISHYNNEYQFQASALQSKIADIKPGYKFVDKFYLDEKNNQLTASFKGKYKKCKKLLLYRKALKTNDRELVKEVKVEQNVLVADMEQLLDVEINLIDRYILEFELVNDNGKIFETNWVKIAKPRTRKVEDYILTKAHGNHVGFLANKFLVLENENNHFTYDSKYNFNLLNHTYSTNCSVKAIDNQVVLDLKIYSLLSKIKKYTLFLYDNYEKKSYPIYETKLDNPNKIVEDSIKLDFEKINEFTYYNARLNFKIGIEYVGTFKETGFIAKEVGDYSVDDRYLFVHEEDDLVTAFYLGENLFNLNIWHTSKDEYEKSIRFQKGREKYFETLKNEDIDEKLIMFEANLGKNYTGNPKYLYQYMISHEEYKDYKFVWTYPDTDSKKIPGNPTLVERGSSEYFYYLAKAKYWVNNILFPVKVKRPETTYLQTWHGTPLKKLGFDIECEGPEKQAFGNLHKESLNWDYFLTDNDYGEEKLVGAFKFKKNVIKKGYPINDIFYNDNLKNPAIDRLKKDYPAINNKKVILYAPTWRDLQGDYVRGYDFELPFDVEELYKEFGNEYVILVKLHHLISDSLVIDDKYKDFLINVSNEEDVMELLCITDALITDYSSVFYDFASAKKPILFYMYDYEEYLNETRGLYVGIDTLPGPIIKNNDDLVQSIKDIEKYTYDKFPKLQKFCDDMSKYCDGNSCKNVLDIVIKDEKND